MDHLFRASPFLAPTIPYIGLIAYCVDTIAYSDVNHFGRCFYDQLSNSTLRASEFFCVDKSLAVPYK